MCSSPDRLYVIFPAAGSGTRMHSDKNKLLMEVDGTTVIERTMAAFKKFSSERSIKIHGVLVVTPGKNKRHQELPRHTHRYAARQHQGRTHGYTRPHRERYFPDFRTRSINQYE